MPHRRRSKLNHRWRHIHLHISINFSWHLDISFQDSVSTIKAIQYLKLIFRVHATDV